MPAAYSYMRYSSQPQAHGNSLRRQIEARDLWLKNHPEYHLDRNSTYKDEGLSGRGQHLHGALGAFLAAVVKGKIKPGSALIVENLDRLGRLPILQQLTLFLQLIDAGITVVTTMDGASSSQEEINKPNGAFPLMASIMTMARAFEESETKSKRSANNWDNIRRGTKRPVGTKKTPGWIRITGNYQGYEVIPERAKIVRLIFDLTAAGWGHFRIAKRLNEEGVTPWGVGKRKGMRWHVSYISKILANRAVIGEHQWFRHFMDPETGKKVSKPDGDPILNHFPAVVPHALWNKIEAIRASREKRPGRVGDQVRNLFSGLAYCGHTGHSVAFSNKTPHYYLRSTSPRSPKGVRLKPWIYGEFENAFFEFAGRLDASSLMDSATQPEREALTERIAKLQAASKAETGKINKLVEALGNEGMQSIPELGDAMLKANATRESLELKIVSAKTELTKVTVDNVSANEALASINLLREKRNDPAFRLRLRDYLAELVEGIFIYLDGEAAFGRGLGVVFNGVDGFSDLLKDMPAAIRKKRKQAEAEFTKAKRWIRAFTVVFRTGVTRRVVVTTDPKKPMHAYASTGVRKKIVRTEEKLVWLVSEETGRNLSLSENEINLDKSEFGTEQEFYDFVSAYYSDSLAAKGTR
jgi:DNA invertase Pin-like site-specific DNA recombinase